jgi:hypothetical protein
MTGRMYKSSYHKSLPVFIVVSVGCGFYNRYGGFSSKELVFNISNCSVFYMYNSVTFCCIQIIHLVHDIPNFSMKTILLVSCLVSV